MPLGVACSLGPMRGGATVGPQTQAHVGMRVPTMPGCEMSALRIRIPRATREQMQDLQDGRLILSLVRVPKSVSPRSVRRRGSARRLCAPRLAQATATAPTGTFAFARKAVEQASAPSMMLGFLVMEAMRAGGTASSRVSFRRRRDIARTTVGRRPIARADMDVIRPIR